MYVQVYLRPWGIPGRPCIFSSDLPWGNIVLDYWFVAWLGLGVAGVAWATFIAQGVSAILALGDSGQTSGRP